MTLDRYELSPTLLLNNPLLNPLNTLDPNYLPPLPLTSHANPAIRVRTCVCES